MKTYLGVELGSTRIKATVIDDCYETAFSGEYTWQSDYVNGIWTYSLENVWDGLQEALQGITNPESIAAMGISGMMHGYLAFDKEWNLLVPFRTWQNTMTGFAADRLTELFGVNIPQRWSIAHLYQAVLNQESHVSRVAHITTLAGYVHFKLTGENVVGIGEASGIFPIDSNTMDYDKQMLQRFDDLLFSYALPWHIRDLLPDVLVAGDSAGHLTETGATALGNILPPGIPMAPPEGDAGTGMVATNAVAPRTGNVSAGTSIFSMVVLDKPLQTIHREIDSVTTPTGRPVAMVHCNNGTNDSNAWISLLQDTLQVFGLTPPKEQLYRKLYEISLEGVPDCDNILVYNYLAGEPIAGVQEGCPLVLRSPGSNLTLSNFMRAILYSTMATLQMGMKILDDENVRIDSLTGHGGLFKTPGVAQRYMAAACNAPIVCMKTSGEGGPYGMALLAAYMDNRKEFHTLDDFLADVFSAAEKDIICPDPVDIAGFFHYSQQFQRFLPVEKTLLPWCHNNLAECLEVLI